MSLQALAPLQIRFRLDRELFRAEVDVDSLYAGGTEPQLERLLGLSPEVTVGLKLPTPPAVSFGTHFSLNSVTVGLSRLP